MEALAKVYLIVCQNEGNKHSGGEEGGTEGGGGARCVDP